MLFTGKGDDGSTSFFGCNDRYSKDNPRTEALGTIDELNSLLGIIKAKAREDKNLFIIGTLKITLVEFLEILQQDLFIIQAEIADIENKGSKKISQEKVVWLENIVTTTEKSMPPIRGFVLTGTTSLNAYFDYARTVTRRAERRIIALTKESKLNKYLLAYINRLSSVLYALARFVATHATGEKEIPPSYK